MTSSTCRVVRSWSVVSASSLFLMMARLSYIGTEVNRALTSNDTNCSSGQFGYWSLAVFDEMDGIAY